MSSTLHHFIGCIVTKFHENLTIYVLLTDTQRERLLESLPRKSGKLVRPTQETVTTEGSFKGEPGSEPQSEDMPPIEIFVECNWTFETKN